MTQDVVRLYTKLTHGRLAHVCRHFDWMDGIGMHPAYVQFNLAAKAAIYAVAAYALHAPAGEVRAVAVAALTVALTAWTWYERRKELVHTGRTVIRSPRTALALNAGGKVPFVVLASQRTGSNLLCGHLASHPEIAMHFELYNDKAIFMYEPHGTAPGSGTVRDASRLAARDRAPLDFLKQAVAGMDERAVGFKLFPEHFKRSERLHTFVDGLLSDPTVRKVVLRRKNLLATCVSTVRATSTGEYLGKVLDDVRVWIKPHEFDLYARSSDDYYAFLRERLVGQTYVEMSYEELVRDPAAALRPVYTLLGVNATASHGRAPPANDVMRRQSTTSTREKIANFDALRAAFLLTARAADFA